MRVKGEFLTRIIDYTLYDLKILTAFALVNCFRLHSHMSLITRLRL